MIMFTEKGEILGDPEFGLGLEDQLFDFNVNQSVIRDRFYAQIGQYIIDTTYQIDIEFDYQQLATQDQLIIYITINGQPVLGFIPSS